MISIPATDEEFFQWIEGHTEGFVVNSDKSLSDKGLPMLHAAMCGHIYSRDWQGYTESKTFKLCSTSRQELEAWVKQTDARELRLCQSCWK